MQYFGNIVLWWVNIQNDIDFFMQPLELLQPGYEDLM